MKHTLLILTICGASLSATAQTASARLVAPAVFSNTSALMASAVTANTVLDVQAVERISATNALQAGSDVRYTAGKSISLLPGFEARAGSVFAAIVAPVSARATAERTADMTVSAWPNPFQEQTTIEYALPENSPVTHTLTDARGSVLRQQNSADAQPAGTYRVGVEGADLPTGVYLYHLQTKNQTKTIRLLKH